jgi:hypothetical protein
VRLFHLANILEFIEQREKNRRPPSTDTGKPRLAGGVHSITPRVFWFTHHASAQNG